MQPGNRKRLPRLLRAVFLALLVLAVLAVLAAVWVRHRLVADLPQTAGRLMVPGLAAPAAIERDAHGIPTLRGASRRDVAFLTGFAHAQDRYFQMDLLRRRSAGELAELFGKPALASDRSIRIHRFREQARRVLAASAPDLRELLEAYAAGANAGLSTLAAPPFEYLVLRTEPAAWKAEDSVLVLFSMFIQLEDVNGATEASLTLLRDKLPEALFRFLAPPSAPEWEAPVAGEPPAAPPLPGPEVLDLRRTPPAPAAVHAALPVERLDSKDRAMASNSWAVAGAWTANGGALLANELHLTLSVPNIWYRAVLAWPAETPGAPPHRLAGATLPGAPLLVVGSNGQVAWGLTNSVLDTSDLVLLDADPSDANRYLTPQGPRPFERHAEVIKIKGEPDQTLDVDWTVWGPVVDTDAQGHRRTVKAVVDEPGAADFEIARLETAVTVDQALDAARASGIPALNFAAADRTGRIGWTVAGRLPRRAGFDGETAASWADGSRSWLGLLPPAEVPKIADPPAGRLWTANNRVLAGDEAAPLGRGNFVLGARARQIRDRLLALPRATADDMRRLQLDDRALFLARWHDLLLQVLTPQAVAADARRGELRRVVEGWGGRATVDSAGYRMVRNFRSAVFQDAFTPLLAPCLAVNPDFDYEGTVNQNEGPLWQLISQKPLHLLDPRVKSWDELLLAAADKLIARYKDHGPLAARTWGERNTVAIDHPMSDALPFLGHRLSMPPRPLPGDDDMPRVQERDFGASLRLVVSPGREEEGFFQMPGGESGNPVSEHYGDLYDGWAEGAAVPLLPGKAVSVLELAPEKGGVPPPSAPTPVPSPARATTPRPERERGATTQRADGRAPQPVGGSAR